MISGLAARLADLAALNQTTSYGALARDLGLTGPGTIARLTTALEALMEQDTAANRPLRADPCHRPRLAPSCPWLFRQGRCPRP